MTTSIACAECGAGLHPPPDPRHIDNLNAAGWTCSYCKRKTK